MLEKVIMIVSAMLVLASEMLGLGYEKVEITAAVALIATLIATVIGRARGEAATNTARAKELDLKLRTTELHLARLQMRRPGPAANQ